MQGGDFLYLAVVNWILRCGRGTPKMCATLQLIEGKGRGLSEQNGWRNPAYVIREVYKRFSYLIN